MKKSTLSFAILSCAGLLAAARVVPAVPGAGGGGGGGDQGYLFEVTITNLTRSQPISPILLATHEEDNHMYTLGMPASTELIELAEDGENGALAAVLAGEAGVSDVQSGPSPLGPGKSQTLQISSRGPARYLSLAGMLVNTNDAFIGLDGMELPRNGVARVLVPAYDAGSETNNELCAYIPGPACGSLFSRDTSAAEGYIHVHAGIHGIGDLDPASYDWRNPAALVTVRRLR